jgi:hypothetical protein
VKANLNIQTEKHYHIKACGGIIPEISKKEFYAFYSGFQKIFDLCFKMYIKKIHTKL